VLQNHENFVGNIFSYFPLFPRYLPKNVKIEKMFGCIWRHFIGWIRS